MDVAGLSHERGARSTTTRRPAGIRDRRPHRSGAGSARPEPARIAPGSPVPPVGRTVAAPDTADQLQSDYFIRMLAQRRRLIDQRIEEYQRAIAGAEAKGDVD